LNKLYHYQSEVWRVRVLEFVLESGAFYSLFVTATISYENLFPIRKRAAF